MAAAQPSAGVRTGVPTLGGFHGGFPRLVRRHLDRAAVAELDREHADQAGRTRAVGRVGCRHRDQIRARLQRRGDIHDIGLREVVARPDPAAVDIAHERIVGGHHQPGGCDAAARLQRHDAAEVPLCRAGRTPRGCLPCARSTARSRTPAARWALPRASGSARRPRRCGPCPRVARSFPPALRRCPTVRPRAS